MTTFAYTGAVQTYTVPAGVTAVLVECQGAQGGTDQLANVGGLGGYTKGRLTTTPGEILNIYVGGLGKNASSGLGAFNGGGVATSGGGGGGGASDVRQGGTALTNRKIVAGGGGGRGGNAGGGGGQGGYPNGADGGGPASGGAGAGGGSQTFGGAGGTPGGVCSGSGTTGTQTIGGLGQNTGSSTDGASGGGGYWGGGGGGFRCGAIAGGGGGGGGGSSYIGSIADPVTVSGTRAGNGQIIIGPVLPPLAPTLLTPTSSTITNAASLGVTFTFTYQPDTTSYPQESFALRRRIGAGAYSYWNVAGSAWSATIVWNPSAATSVTVPAAAWANEQDYSWSIANAESFLHGQGPFAADSLLTARTPPAVTITAPTAIVSTTRPIITWTESFTSPWVVISYEVKLFTVAVANATGFDASSTAPLWTSGIVAGAGLTTQVSTTLAKTNHRVFVRVQQTGAQWSTWRSFDFLVAFAGPGVPVIATALAVDVVTSCPTVAITINARDNLLSANDASFEATVGTWVAGANTTIATTALWAANDTQALKLTATAIGSVTASTASYAVIGNGLYTLVGTFRAPVTARLVTLTVSWYDIAAALISSQSSAATTDSVTVDTDYTLNVTAPANAITCKLTITVASLAAGEAVYADKLGVMLASSTPWGMGGYLDVTTVTVEFSDDVASGVWGVLYAGVPLVRQAVSVDYTAPPGAQRAYRATLLASDTRTSDASASATATMAVTDFWLIDTVAPTSNLKLTVVDDLAKVTPIARGVFTSIGRAARQVVTGLAGTQRGGSSARGVTGLDMQKLMALLSSGHRLLLQQPRESGLYPRHIYLLVTSDVNVQRLAMIPAADRVISWEWDEAVLPVGESLKGWY